MQIYFFIFTLFIFYISQTDEVIDEGHLLGVCQIDLNKLFLAKHKKKPKKKTLFYALKKRSLEKSKNNTCYSRNINMVMRKCMQIV